MSDQQGWMHDYIKHAYGEGGELAADHDAAWQVTGGAAPTFTLGGFGGSGTVQAPATVTCSGGLALPRLGAGNG